DKVAKLIPPALDMTLEKALEENPALKQLEQSDPQVKELLGIGRRLEGMTRHASVHAAGVVIAPKPLTEFVPLYKGARDEIVTQWAMKEIEKIGLLKMDFLGLSTLTLLDDAVKEIKRTEGVDIDLEKIPMDDAKTYELFSNGQTAGVFQFESSGMRETLRKAKPQRFDDLIALNALYRPGPLRAGVIDDFIERRHGRAEIKYEVPQMAPILSDTYGIIAYQEQVMRCARDLAGFTMGEADLLRKAMGKKNPEVMQAQRARFVKGAVERGLNEKKATKVFDIMEYFAGYGFNKSHSTAYALLAYQTGYLKANYPWHFMAALLTIEAQNTEKLSGYLQECKELGVPVLPPDINVSELQFSVAKEGIRFGLTAVKNVGEGAILSMLGVRAAQKKIEGLDRLCEEVDLRLVNKRVLESLAKAGAFDSFYATDAKWTAQPATVRRARLFGSVDRAIEHGGRRQKDKERGQSFLFGGGGADDDGSDSQVSSASSLADAMAWTEQQLLAFEKEALGLYLSGHPLTRYSADLKTIGAKTINELAAVQGDATVGGIIAACRIVKTRKGDRMAVFMLEDLTGTVETVVYSEPYKQYASLIENDAMVLVKGRIEIDDEGRAKIRTAELSPISVLTEKLTRALHVKMAVPPCGRPTFEALADVFTRHRGDRRVTFELELTNREKPVRIHADVPQVRVRPSERLVAEVERICGAGSVVLR
ncbi:MAG TPA: DNA polymerase III subunit alpha, partial [Steroidobacteraceae bacterium]|nr:DNA polymerase III subunit alpha [Steroidobacteraceae bacterium]